VIFEPFSVNFCVFPTFSGEISSKSARNRFFERSETGNSFPSAFHRLFFFVSKLAKKKQ
jgi:hypothetical protein